MTYMKNFFAERLAYFDAYEVHGIRKFGKGRSNHLEQVPDDQAQYWSLFGHLPFWGLECIGDFKTREHAEEVRVRITGRQQGRVVDASAYSDRPRAGTIESEVGAPWSLHFYRDGTEDVGVICDAAGDDLLCSRYFWLPEDEDPVPGTLAAMWLAKAAPNMLAALLMAQQALNEAPRFRVGKTNSYKIAGRVDQAIAEAKGGRS